MKINTLRKPQFRRLMLLGSALAGLTLASTRAQVTVEVIHYFTVESQHEALNQMQKEFEAANPDIKLKFTYVPFGELVSRTLQMAAVRKPPGISAIDNPDVLRVAKGWYPQGHFRRRGQDESLGGYLPGTKSSCH